ncbi:MAG: type III pantothenate kinase [Rhodospirillales bacterium]
MLLAINANNTNVKFALVEIGGEDDVVRGQWRIGTDAARTHDEYAVWLNQLMEFIGLDRAAVTAAAIASVVPRADYELQSLCRAFFAVEPMMIGSPNVALGMDVLIDRPAEAGADRLMNAIGGFQHYGGPLIVVDFGTGTTLDIIDASGNYTGGVIAPGINLSVDALYEAAAKLPRISVERPANVIGKSTVEAMKSGVFWGYVGLIEGLVSRVREELGDPGTRVVATGGLASLFAGSTEVLDTIDRDLTLKGLCEVYRRNRGAAG